MNFFKGQVVIHPHHGPATVNKISTRLMKENTTDYLKLEVHNPPLMVGVPAGRAEELGVRSTVDADDVREIFDVLVAPSDAADTVWSRRMKNNTTRLRSGNIRTIAGLIRDLTRRNEEKRLSFAEMNLLREANGPFVAELAIVFSVTEEEIETMVNTAILDGTRPSHPITTVDAEPSALPHQHSVQV